MDLMPNTLNLPPCNLQQRRTPQGRVQLYDIFRQKWVAETPEELVRQHFLQYLVGFLGYSPYRLAVERGLMLNGTQRRFDALIYDVYGRPLVVVEFKAPQIAVTQRTFDQIVRYNMILKAPYIMVSNGLRHYCAHVDTAGGDCRFLSEIPPYDSIKDVQKDF